MRKHHYHLHHQHKHQQGTIHYLSPRRNSIFCSQIKNDFPESGSRKARPLYFASNCSMASNHFSFMLPLPNLPPMPGKHALLVVPSKPPGQHQRSRVANQTWYHHLQTLHCVLLHPTFPCGRMGFVSVIFLRNKQDGSLLSWLATQVRPFLVLDLFHSTPAPLGWTYPAKFWCNTARHKS